MKVSLVENFLKIFNEKSFVSNVKILKNNSNSTLIEIKGHQLDVPFVLKNDGKYIAKIKNEILNIIEIKENIKSDNKSFNIKDFLDTVVGIKDQIDNNPAIFNFLPFFTDKFKIKDESKKNNYFFKDKNNNFIFIFDIPLYNNPSKIFIKIDEKKNINISIFCEDIKNEKKNEFETMIRDYYKEKNKILNINIFDKKQKFYDNISIYINKVDIKI
jgi:hypothetical protein